MTTFPPRSVMHCPLLAMVPVALSFGMKKEHNIYVIMISAPLIVCVASVGFVAFAACLLACVLCVLYVLVKASQTVQCIPVATVIYADVAKFR